MNDRNEREAFYSHVFDEMREFNEKVLTSRTAGDVVVSDAILSRQQIDIYDFEFSAKGVRIRLLYVFRFIRIIVEKLCHFDHLCK